MNMMGAKQDMRIFSRRVYAPGGDLHAIESVVEEARGETRFDALVEDGELVLTIEMAGEEQVQRHPKPAETLADALKTERWVRKKPEVGDRITFSLFDPTFQKEITGKSTVLAVNERILEGVPTAVYEVKTNLDVMELESVSHVAEDGSVLEDVTAGMLTMRLEPEKVAKDVDYNNDVIVSNAAYINRPIPEPRTRDALRLALRGPLNENHLFNDERQYMTDMDDHTLFVAKRPSLEDFTPARLPVTEEHVAKWLEPSTFVQSDAPEIIAQAAEIVGEEKDTLEITRKLSAWVNDNVHSTYSARLTNALEVLSSLEGDCTEHSILFVGLARAAGVPAREVAGVVYVDGPRPGFYFHQWAKVWVGKWIDVDPTLGQWLADVTHVKLAEGDLFEQSKLIPLIGHLQIEYLPEKAEENADAEKEKETAGKASEAPADEEAAASPAEAPAS